MAALEQDAPEKRSAIAVTPILTALAFGTVALMVVLAELTVPIPGTGVVTDPRELFTTIGAGLSGPVGGFLIGILAGVGESWMGEPADRIPVASLLAHVTGGLWMGFAYKKLVYERLRMPGMLLGWAGLVLIFYYGFAVPGFVIGRDQGRRADDVCRVSAGCLAGRRRLLPAQRVRN